MSGDPGGGPDEPDAAGNPGIDAGDNPGIDAATTPRPDASTSDPFAQARQDCVDRINAFRATEGKPPYARWTAGEACGDDQARRDADSNTPHGNFGDCGEFAQNTCPGWPSVESVIQSCLQAMWDEGPGPFPEHGHYLNMSSTQYSEVSCAFYEMPNGEIWHNQNFR